MSSRQNDVGSGPVRVLLVGPDLARTPGGMAQITGDLLASRLLRADGVEARFVASHVEGGRPTKLWVMVGAAWRVARSGGDLVHVQVATGRSVERKLLLAAAARLTGKRVVTQLHGARLGEDFDEGSHLHRAAFSALLGLSDAVLALASAQERWLTSRFPHAASRVRVLPNFVPHRAMSQRSEPEGAATVLFAGRLGARKGIWDLLAAIERLPAGLPVRFVLAGDGEVEAVRAAVAASPRLRGRVTTLGWVGAPQLDELMDTAAIVVLPTYAEGLPMVLLQAMAHGCAVLATPVGGIPDLVEDGITGVLVVPGDVAGLATALTRLVEEPAATHALGLRGQQRALSHFAEAAVVPRLADLYRLVRGRGTCS